jgi:hypothetical protein
MSEGVEETNFTDYEETTVDPGWSFIVGVVTACLLLNLTLPCLVSLGSRYERKRKSKTLDDDDKSTSSSSSWKEHVRGENASQSTTAQDNPKPVAKSKVSTRHKGENNQPVPPLSPAGSNASVVSIHSSIASAAAEWVYGVVDAVS